MTNPRHTSDLRGQPRIPRLIAALGLLVCVAARGAGQAPVEEFTAKQLAEGLAKFQALEARFAEGRARFAKGDLAGAADRFESCAAAMPGHVYADFYAANIYYLRNDFSRALEAVERAELGLPFMDALDDYARHRRVRAMDDARRLLDSERDATRSCRERRELEEAARVVETDRKRLEDETERHDRPASGRASLYAGFHGNILFQLRRFDEAYAQYRRALEADISNGDAWNNVTALLVLAGRAREAEECLEKADAAGVGDDINPKLRVRVAESLGKPTSGILEQEYGGGGTDGIRLMRFSVNVSESRAAAVPLYVNAYVVYDAASFDAVIVDPGAADPRIEAFIAEKGLKPRLILNTHGHIDHTGGNARYAGLYGIPVAAPGGDRPLYEKCGPSLMGKAELTALSKTIDAGALRGRVFSTPGHTAGSSCVLFGTYLLSGDSLFEDGVGKLDADTPSRRTKLRRKLVSSLLAMLSSLPATTVILPGHGRATTASKILEVNPYLRSAD